MPPRQLDFGWVEFRRAQNEVVKKWDHALDSTLDQAVGRWVALLQQVKEGGQVGAICS